MNGDPNPNAPKTMNDTIPKNQPEDQTASSGSPSQTGYASLFEIPECLSPRLKLEREWMKECEILTHHADIPEDPWIAVSMRICKARLEGYDLTEEEKTEIPALFAGYCRLLDEGNMVGYGATRAAAIEDLVIRGVIPSMEQYQHNADVDAPAHE